MAVVVDSQRSNDKARRCPRLMKLLSKKQVSDGESLRLGLDRPQNAREMVGRQGQACPGFPHLASRPPQSTIVWISSLEAFVATIFRQRKRGGVALYSYLIHVKHKEDVEIEVALLRLEERTEVSL